MGFLDNNEEFGLNSFADKLDLVEYEGSLIRKFNDISILHTKYRAEEFGITFDKNKKESDVYLYESDEVVTICPEPLEFIKDFDDVSDNTSKANSLLIEKIKSFHRISLNKKPVLKGNSTYGDRMWMNKTLTGINLRPGNLNDDRDDFTPIRMCDDNVHGLIAGRTGSGKSVFINALILSLITEYAPWELNLYLADFKKVELSRYMNNSDEINGNTPFTPHVNACAATSEIRYVISLIKYLVDCMNARQELFARLGVTKIQEFRNKYNLVLPRVLLIVDEFQQLFTEATNREKEEIQTMLNSITKLGRATGFHLIFASQEMSGTLRGNTLANFKIRMALPCNQQISTDILGNSQAVNLERGFVLVNTDSGDELKNKRYRVPFIETDKKDNEDNDEKTPFYNYLDEIKLASKLFDLNYKTAAQKFYREELQETEMSYRNDLDRINEKKNELVSKNHSLFDAVILGKTVLYSPKVNDKVSFYIEKGRNKGVMIACPDADNAARIRKLLAENFFRSNEETYHFGMELNNLVLEKYKIDESIKNFSKHRYYNCETDKAVELLQMFYFMRQEASKIMNSSRENMYRISECEKKLFVLMNDEQKVSESKNYKAQKCELEIKIKEIDSKISELTQNSKKKIENPIIKYLERCSAEITKIPAFGDKAALVSLWCYKEVISVFTLDLDIVSATKKSVEIINKSIENISKNEAQNEVERKSNEFAIKRNKILQAAILYYLDRYTNANREAKSLDPYLSRSYEVVQSAVAVFKNDCEIKKNAIGDTARLVDIKERMQDELAEMKLKPNEIEIVETELLQLVNAFVTKIFDTAYALIGYKKDKPAIPNVVYEKMNEQLLWKVHSGIVEEKIELMANDILNVYISACRSVDLKTQMYKKTIFWINGLDEIEKIPSQLVEIIRNAINQNILIVAIITSELKDTTIRKAFDYSFVTGNIEKFYSMFNIKYTKQPLDSIVVNFGIRSKGFDIPFKMYKSNLEDIQAPNFIEQLLNE